MNHVIRLSVANGNLYEACRLRANGWKQRWDETMGQTAISCTDRKLPGSPPELRLTRTASVSGTHSLDYICNSIIKDQWTCFNLPSVDQKYPFLHYASMNWAAHARESADESAESLDVSHQFLATSQQASSLRVSDVYGWHSTCSIHLHPSPPTPRPPWGWRSSLSFMTQPY
jgi:hypothetical protein